MRRLVAHAGLVFGFSHLQLLIEQPAPTRGVPACGRRTPMPWPPFNGMPLTPTPTATPPPKIFGGPKSRYACVLTPSRTVRPYRLAVCSQPMQVARDGWADICARLPNGFLRKQAVGANGHAQLLEDWMRSC